MGKVQEGRRKMFSSSLETYDHLIGVPNTNANQEEKQMSNKEKKYVHTINLEIPMDFWYAVEKQVVDSKISGDTKVTKKGHILDLIELGYSQKEKQLKKGKIKPSNDTSDDGGWKTDE